MLMLSWTKNERIKKLEILSVVKILDWLSI